MAVRSAIRRYPDLVSFLKEYKSTLRVGAVFLPPGDAKDLADELKLDLQLPLVGRVGPVDAQVVNRFPDGSVALRVPEMPASVSEVLKGLFQEGEAIKQWLLSSGQVAPKVDTTEVNTLKAKIAALEQQLEEARARGPVMQAEAPPQEEPAPSSVEAAPVAAPASGEERPRGLIVPDLSRRAPAASGKMGDRSLRDQLMKVAIEKSTGLFSFTYGNGLRRWGFWYKGGVVGWRAEPPEEAEVLGVLLFRANQLTKEQLAQSLELMERNGVRQGEALIEMGVLSFPQLVLLLQRQAEFVLQRVLKDKEGSWTWHRLPDLPEKFVTPPVRVASVLFRAMRSTAKELPAEELAAYLRPFLDRYVFFQPDVDRALEEMKLTNEENQFVKIIRSTSYRGRELFAVSNLARSQTASMIWCLNELSVLDFRAEESDARSAERNSKMMEDRQRQMQKGTLFGRLDLHWICTKPDVEAAYKRFLVEYSPENLARYPADQRADLLKMAQLGKEAYEKLVDDRSRREYRISITERMMIEQSAEMLAKKGEMAVVKGQINEAIDCYSKALELMPNMAEYKEGMKKAQAAR